MKSANILIKATVICLVPLLACSIYYTSEQLSDVHPFIYVAAQMALPILLISCAYIANLVVLGNCKGWRFYLSSSSIIISALIIASIWL